MKHNFIDLFLIVLLHWANCNSHTDSHLNYLLNLLVFLLPSQFFMCVYGRQISLSFIIVIVVMAWVDISRRVWRSGSQWANAGCIYCGLCCCLDCLFLGYQWIDATAYNMYSGEVWHHVIINTGFCGRALTAIVYVSRSKQLSDCREVS